MHDAAHRLVYLIDGKDFSRNAITELLGGAGFRVLPYSRGAAHIRDWSLADPACVLLDLEPLDRDGLRILRLIQAQDAPPPVIVMAEAGPVTAVVEAIKLGAIDFLVKPLSPPRLLDALEEGFRQLSYRKRKYEALRSAQSRLSGLTPRERDVLSGLVNGEANKTIAHRLGISPRTVEIHRANLMAKLGAGNLSEALRIAFTAGMTATGDDEEDSSVRPDDSARIEALAPAGGTEAVFQPG